MTPEEFQIEIERTFKEQEQKVQIAHTQSKRNHSAQKLHQFTTQQISTQIRKYLESAFSIRNNNSVPNKKSIYSVKQIPYKKYTLINFAKDNNQDTIQSKINQQDGDIEKHQPLCDILTRTYIDQLSKQNSIKSNQQLQDTKGDFKITNIIQFLKKKSLSLESIRRLLKNNIRRFLFYGKQIEKFKIMCSHQGENKCHICEALQPLYYRQKLAQLNNYFPGDYQVLWKEFFPELLCIFDQAQAQVKRNSKSQMK